MTYTAAFFVVRNIYRVKSRTRQEDVQGRTHRRKPYMASYLICRKCTTLESFQKELTDVEKIYKETTGKDMVRFYRPPQGKIQQRKLKNGSRSRIQNFFSGVLPMSTGTIQISLQKQKRLINCSNASTQARSSCSTAHQKQTPTS